MWFEETRYASFESSSFPVPNGAEAFLQRVYGDECLSLTTGFVKSSPHYRVDLRMVPKRKLTVTLVLATCGRISEVSKWLDSASRAAEDAGVDVQLIVADQNDDERLVPLLAGIPETWRLDYVKIAGKGVCLARNSVLHMIKGDIVAFPDDDCIYEIRSLREVFLHFKENRSRNDITGSKLTFFVIAFHKSFTLAVLKMCTFASYSLGNKKTSVVLMIENCRMELNKLKIHKLRTCTESK